ncbi:methylenetetrahydrofolate reductase [NAD(P)H] [Angelakisella massiliensis]|uniref:methylenetetrahydrofolate reductase [NAD(P)H] n=1 Tax=Angelakisella massiliensis TaxID=1871018 RepID=UPI0024B27A6B|nr:methylenetetrahydrofolate reductase [NAD(P)H] [Angelakisella massiliensis]
MSIAEIFARKKTEGRPVFSFEIFPPKKDSPVDTIYRTLDGLQGMSPDFISVTFGAGGSGKDQPTRDIAALIQGQYHIPALAHLTCVNYSRQEISSLLEDLKAAKITNILALRGDINPNIPPHTDFHYAAELISFIKEQGDFHVSAACYPEGHCECPDLVTDVLNLRKKVDAGAEHLVSQLFFDNNLFYSFVERARIAGINVPIEAGIMPVVNKRQIERMVSLCGASLPAKFSRMMSRYSDRPEALRDAGIAYAVDQIVDLISNGVEGIHLYTMNNPQVARRIWDNVSSLL